jgi:hypothetical protein
VYQTFEVKFGSGGVGNRNSVEAGPKTGLSKTESWQLVSRYSESFGAEVANCSSWGVAGRVLWVLA